MKTRKELENEYKEIFATQYTKTDQIKNPDNTGYNFYGEAWASVISIDIIGFKKMVSKIDNENMVKIIQLFTDTVASTARDTMFKTSFRDMYFAGDEVIVVFDGNKKEKIDDAIDFTFYINSQINTVLSEFLVKNIPSLGNFKVGIGLWVSNDNTLVYNGLKGSNNYVRSTLIGSAINNANILSGLAGRGLFSDMPILINEAAFINSVKKEETLKKWMTKKRVGINGMTKEIWGGNITKKMY